MMARSFRFVSVHASASSPCSNVRPLTTNGCCCGRTAEAGAIDWRRGLTSDALPLAVPPPAPSPFPPRMPLGLAPLLLLFATFAAVVVAVVALDSLMTLIEPTEAALISSGLLPARSVGVCVPPVVNECVRGSPPKWWWLWLWAWLWRSALLSDVEPSAAPASCVPNQLSRR